MWCVLVRLRAKTFMPFGCKDGKENICIIYKIFDTIVIPAKAESILLRFLSFRAKGKISDHFIGHTFLLWDLYPLWVKKSMSSWIIVKNLK